MLRSTTYPGRVTPHLTEFGPGLALAGIMPVLVFRKPAHEEYPAPPFPTPARPSAHSPSPQSPADRCPASNGDLTKLRPKSRLIARFTPALGDVNA